MVIDPKIKEEEVILKFDDVTIVEALRLAVDQLPDQVELLYRSGDVLYLGRPAESDKISRPYFVRGEAARDYVAPFTVAAGQAAEIAHVGDAIIVRATPETHAKLERLYGQLLGYRGQWIVDVKFLELTRRATEELGIDWEVAGSVVLNSKFAHLFKVINGDLSGAITADLRRSDVKILSNARLSVVEGNQGKLQVGDTTPIPVRAISDNGTVTTTGYQNIDTGILLDVQLRTVPGDLVEVKVIPEMSRVTGFIDGAPIRSRRRIESVAVVKPGTVIAIGGLDDSRVTRDVDSLPFVELLGPLAGVIRDDTEQRKIFIVLKIIEPDYGSSVPRSLGP